MELYELANVLSRLVQNTSRELRTRRRRVELCPNIIEITMNLKYLLRKFEQVFFFLSLSLSVFENGSYHRNVCKWSFCIISTMIVFFSVFSNNLWGLCIWMATQVTSLDFVSFFFVANFFLCDLKWCQAHMCGDGNLLLIYQYC